MPEITMKDRFGAAMFRTIRKYRINSILEIGAFDGDGSTQVLARALHGKSAPLLVSLESRSDRYENLVRNVLSYPFVRPVRMSSLGRNSLSVHDFEKDVWASEFNGLRFPREQVKGWFEEDLAALSKVERGFLEDQTESWDAALIDGGEFFGYDEFRLLKDRCRCFFLDDSFAAFKTARVRHELGAMPDWRLEWSDPDVRHGAAIFVRHDLARESVWRRWRAAFAFHCRSKD